MTGQYGHNVEVQWPILFKVAGLYGLQNRDVLAGMCGIIGHESAGRWWPIHEFGTDFSQYGKSATGQDYGGRGLIQTTWQSNYEAAARVIKERTGKDYDLVNNPDLILNDPELAAHCACVYWVDHAGGILVDKCKQHDWGEVIHYVWGLNAPGNPVFDRYYTGLRDAAEYLLAR